MRTCEVLQGKFQHTVLYNFLKTLASALWHILPVCLLVLFATILYNIRMSIQDFDKRIAELASRSQKLGVCTFTDFLTQQEIATVQKISPCPVFFEGGGSFCQRKIARFGEETMPNSQFPLTILECELLGGKFSTQLSHRDVLGALMALGIERNKVGDIFVQDGVFVVVHNSVLPLVQQQLTSIGKNNVEVKILQQLPPHCAPRTKQIAVPVSSNRLDNVIAKVFSISRETAQQLIERDKVQIDGSVANKPTRVLKVGEATSVRGYGKFVFDGTNGQSKKGKTYMQFSVFC